MKWTKDFLLTLLTGDDGRSLGNPFIKHVPNAKDFLIVIQGLDTELLKHDIEKSVKSHVVVKTGKNKRANRYLEHQIMRLRRRPKCFWKIIQLMVLRSKVWFVVHLNRVEPRWYRTLPVWEVLKLWGQVQTFLRRKSQVDFRRVYIPKKVSDDGEVLKWRPLGVPTLPWRIYLSMLNTAFAIWLEPFWEEGQHGYYPGKGTLTAWREILKKLSAKDIFEFDLKQFFPSVEIQALTKILIDMGIGVKWARYIEHLNMAVPKLCERKQYDDEIEIDEKNQIERMWHEDELIRRRLEDSLIIETIEPGVFAKYPPTDDWPALLGYSPGWEGQDEVAEFRELRYALGAKWDRRNIMVGAPTGLPQGGGISPILSVQTLKELFRLNPTLLMYADDGLVFDTPVLETPELKKRGIMPNWDKSGWVKKDGVWLKPLKFLGLIYDGVKDQLWSETTPREPGKKPKSLLIEREKIEEILTDVWGYKDGKPRETNIWSKLFQSRISGLIQSMHYNGVYNLNKYWDDWDVSIAKKSWAASPMAKFRARKEKVKLGLYNRSTLASTWLLNKLIQKNSAIREPIIDST